MDEKIAVSNTMERLLPMVLEDSTSGRAPLAALALLPAPDWSYHVATRQVVLPQNASSVGVSKDPSARNPTSLAVPSLARTTLIALPV